MFSCEELRKAYAGSSALDRAARKVAANRQLETAQGAIKEGKYDMAVMHMRALKLVSARHPLLFLLVSEKWKEQHTKALCG